jgi:hypothetical protein
MWQVNEVMWGNGGASGRIEGGAHSVANAMLLRMLDEIDYGVLVMDEQGPHPAHQPPGTTRAGQRPPGGVARQWPDGHPSPITPP